MHMSQMTVPAQSPKAKLEIPIIKQKDHYRLQLSNMRISDDAIALYLDAAREKLLELHRQSLLQSGKRIAGMTFHDVPLIELTLNRNQLADKSLPIIVSFLLSNRHIESFEILGNCLSDAIAPVIADLISKSHIQRIKVGDNFLTSAGAQIIADGVANSHDSFVQLHLGGNPIRDEGVCRLCEAAGQRSRIEALGLRDVGMSGDGWLSVLLTCVQEGSMIRELQLKGNELRDETATAVENVLTNNRNAKVALATFSICNCRITPTGFRSVTYLFHQASHLEHLDISNNPIGDEGFEHLLNWLCTPTSDSFHTLFAQRIGITTASLEKLIAEPNTALRNMRHLDLAGNPFELEATKRLGDVVRCAPKLTRFSVHGCGLGGPDLRVLVDALLTCDTLKDFDFSSNFSDDAGGAWESFVFNSKKIERLLLTDNQMPVSVTGSIIEAAVRSPNRNLHIFQVGGQSKVPPLANQVLPSALTTLAASLRRNRAVDDAQMLGDQGVLFFDKAKGVLGPKPMHRQGRPMPMDPMRGPMKAPPPPPGPPPRAMHGLEFNPHMVPGMPPMPPMYSPMPQQQFLVVSSSPNDPFMGQGQHVVLMPPNSNMSLGNSPMVLLTQGGQGGMQQHQAGQQQGGQQGGAPGGQNVMVVTHPHNLFGLLET